MELASQFVPHHFTASPFVGARWHFRSFLPPVPYGGSPPALRAAKFAAQLYFFFAAGAFTGFQLIFLFTNSLLFVKDFLFLKIITLFR